MVDQQGELFSYPPSDETLSLTRVALDRAVASGARIDAVLINNPARSDDYFWTGRLHEIQDLAADATYRSRGLSLTSKRQSSTTRSHRLRTHS